ncbi:2OG-Fe(II) oxygenase [Nostoc minutum NIES-26]|uniref:2OG-Fe(II) oxygenase n=1 Tax=Nostoc minutum NIES-26 TaxID=1844469 RepID=A0A367QBJ8_9NOSO|nr:2OG-Fe(II) oxygenase [Nostoc minutum NIES-26]
MYDNLMCHQLDENHQFWIGNIPDDLHLTPAEFNILWDMHPCNFYEIKIYGRLVKTPRWQQAYGINYQYTGRINKALPIPLLLEPLFQWSKANIDNRLNGILLNWYDGKLHHYIGKHRDSTINILNGAPIVTISFGEERIFRLRPWKEEGYQDFMTKHGCVFVMPYETNKAWTHEVPLLKKYQRQRISITLRAFNVTSHDLASSS